VDISRRTGTKMFSVTGIAEFLRRMTNRGDKKTVRKLQECFRTEIQKDMRY
jgi:hypothetical protein